MGVSIVLKYDDRPDRPGSWTVNVMTAQGRHQAVGLGYNPGEALNYALLHLGYIGGFLEPTDISGD